MIVDGIIELDNIYGVPFKVDLIPKKNTTSRPAFYMTPTSITVHNTANKARTANATNHTRYVDSVKDSVSWHFTVDDKIIYQELPINENAWHAGDGENGEGNRKSISIEITEHEGIDWEKAKVNAAKLIILLFESIPTLSRIFPHQHWSGKYCPRRILDEGWEKFINIIEEEKRMNTFADFSEIPDWAKEDVKEAMDRGIVKGYETGLLKPEALMTRVEAIVLANKVYTKLIEDLSNN